MFSFSEKAITLYYFLLNKKSKQGLDTENINEKYFYKSLV